MACHHQQVNSLGIGDCRINFVGGGGGDLLDSNPQNDATDQPHRTDRLPNGANVSPRVSVDRLQNQLPQEFLFAIYVLLTSTLTRAISSLFVGYGFDEDVRTRQQMSDNMLKTRHLNADERAILKSNPSFTDCSFLGRFLVGGVFALLISPSPKNLHLNRSTNILLPRLTSPEKPRSNPQTTAPLSTAPAPQGTKKRAIRLGLPSLIYKSKTIYRSNACKDPQSPYRDEPRP